MAKSILHAPIEITREVLGGGRFSRVGDVVSDHLRVDFVDSDTLRHQDVLRGFSDKFGLVNLVDPESDENEQDERIEQTAAAITAEGLAGPGITLEVRGLISEYDLFDYEMNAKRLQAINQLGEVLVTDYGVDVVPTSHAIMPTVQPKEPIAPADVWGCISHELEAFRRQIHGVSPEQSLGVLAVTSPDYAHHIFQEQLLYEGDVLDSNGLLLLKSVGHHPRENVLAGSIMSRAQMALSD